MASLGLELDLKSQLHCPFCGEVVAETTLLSPLRETEALVRDHILSKHPIRWRISPKFRRAVLLSRGA